MDIKLTHDGVMVRLGTVISTGVSVHIIPSGEIKVSYRDEYGSNRVDIRNNRDVSLMKNRDEVINSALSKSDNYLVIWEPSIY